MKIEKINDKQIRCTLTKEDLANREIKLSELAYGSEKTRALFQDMMRVAAQDFGFEADNMPLVIEAIPVSMDSIILIITKVEDPEELDTRFARFSPEEQEHDSGYSFSDLMDKLKAQMIFWPDQKDLRGKKTRRFQEYGADQRNTGRSFRGVCGRG